MFKGKTKLDLFDSIMDDDNTVACTVRTKSNNRSQVTTYIVRVNDRCGGEVETVMHSLTSALSMHQTMVETAHRIWGIE